MRKQNDYKQRLPNRSDHVMMNCIAHDPNPAVNISDKLNDENNMDGKKPPPQQYQQRFRNSSL